MVATANKGILGCFVSIPMASNQGELFRSYIWGPTGISDILKQLNHEDYGSDLILILFQYYVNPVPYLMANIKKIERYRKNEKSIGIPIVVNDDNFFSRSEEGRRIFLKQSILRKLDLLREVVKKQKLDTDIDRLEKDVEGLSF